MSAKTDSKNHEKACRPLLEKLDIPQELSSFNDDDKPIDTLVPMSAGIEGSRRDLAALSNRKRWNTEPDKTTKEADRQRKRHDTLRSIKSFSSTAMSPVAPDDENQERGNWSNQIEFFLSCLGCAVGLGNVWRFPYLVHKHGGGAFLIPYFIMLFFCGIPLLMLELSMGQYFSEGPITIWSKVSPMWKGLGISMIASTALLATYYNAITAWAIFYSYASMAEVLPWTCCDPAWAMEGCLSNDASCVALNQSSISYESDLVNITNKTRYPADDYFHNGVLNLSGSLAELGYPLIHLLPPLFIAWLVVCLVLMRGVKTLGKAVYFTSIFPYFVLFVLLIRAAIEPGAKDGIIYYLNPKWEQLLSPEVWGAAAAQIFYSTGVASGQMITLASYSRFHNNIYRDSLVIGIGNSATSIYSGFVVFSILGAMAKRNGVSVEDVVSGGPGLTFITYPQAVTLLPLPQLWSVLFFVMLIILAWSTMFPLTECIVTSIIDNFRQLRPWKFWIMVGIAVVEFSGGLFVISNGGMYVLELLDRYAVGNVIIVAGFMELIVFGWVYGADKVIDNIHQMTGIRLSQLWKILWKFLCPGLLLATALFSWSQSKPIKYQDYQFSVGETVFGWLITGMIIMIVPLYVLYYKFIRPKLDRGPKTNFAF